MVLLVARVEHLEGWYRLALLNNLHFIIQVALEVFLLLDVLLGVHWGLDCPGWGGRRGIRNVPGFLRVCVCRSKSIQDLAGAC